MIFFDSAHAATTNIKLPQDMSMWDRVQAPVDISANGHLIMGLFNYTTGMVIFFLFLFASAYSALVIFIQKKETKSLITHMEIKIPHKKLGLVFGIAVFIFIDMAITVQSNNDLVNTFFQFS